MRRSEQHIGAAALPFLLLALGCVASSDFRAEQTKRLKADQEVALRAERINVVIAERDAATRDAARELALRRELESQLAHQKSEFSDIIARQQEEIVGLQKERDTLRERLRDPELQGILACREEVKSCLAMVHQKEQENRVQSQSGRELSSQTEQKAFYKGMLTVWESLAIKATPTSDGMLFKDYYLTVNVNVRNHTVYSFRVKTAESGNGFNQTLSAVADLASVAKYIK